MGSFRTLIRILKLYLFSVSKTSLGKIIQTGNNPSRKLQGISLSWCLERTILTLIDLLLKRRSDRFSKICRTTKH